MGLGNKNEIVAFAFWIGTKNEGERAKNHEEKIGDKKLHGYYLVTGR